MEKEVEVATDSEEEPKREQYVVGAGDTLKSIAMKFDIPVAWLKQSNHIFSNDVFPGDVLTILPPPPSSVQLDPINVEWFDSEHIRENEQGKLFLVGDLLRFEPAKRTVKPININIIGYLECAVLPHPRNGVAHHALFLTYLDDPYDTASLSVASFEGEKELLARYADAIAKRAEYTRKEKRYTPPDANAIHRLALQERIQSDPGKMKVPQANVVAMPAPVMRRPRTVSHLPDIDLMGGTSRILGFSDVSRIRSGLPIRFKYASWLLLFQLSRDGKSYTTFYDKTQRHEPLVLVIRTADGDKLGAYVSNGLKMSRRYYGSGETFVFHFNPEYHDYHWSVTNGNQYFVASSREEIALGGGGSSAIWLDGEFRTGVSEPCKTYNSPALASKTRFEVLEVEVWVIGS